MKFEPGQAFTEAGVSFRILSGNRCDGDMVIEISINGCPWYRPPISLTMILASFKYQVEENNYGVNGKVKSGRGGAYLLSKIERACLNGWEEEAEIIRQQRKNLADQSDYLRGQLSLPV